MSIQQDNGDDLTSLHWLQNLTVQLGCVEEQPQQQQQHLNGLRAVVPSTPKRVDSTPKRSQKRRHKRHRKKTSQSNKINVTQLANGQQDTQDGLCPSDYSLDASVKPPYSYAALICLAMRRSAQNKMTLNQIYGWIRDNFAYYRNGDKSWENSIRHNLSLNKCFHKVARTKREEPGKGGFWTMNPAYKDTWAASATKSPQNDANNNSSSSTPDSQEHLPKSAFSANEPLELLAKLKQPLPQELIQQQQQEPSPVCPVPLPQSPVAVGDQHARAGSGANLQFADVLALMHSTEESASGHGEQHHDAGHLIMENHSQPQFSSSLESLEFSFYEPDMLSPTATPTTTPATASDELLGTEEGLDLVSLDPAPAALAASSSSSAAAAAASSSSSSSLSSLSSAVASAAKNLSTCYEPLLWEEQALLPLAEEAAVNLEHLMSLDTMPVLGSVE